MEYLVRVSTTGAAGSAAGDGTTQTPVTGFIEAIHLDYTGLPATTDVTVSEVAAPGRTILSRANTATDGVFHPRVQAQDTAGANIAGVYTPIYVSGQILKVAVAQSDEVVNGLIARILVSERWNRGT